jgi:hypothetical protein
MQIHALDPAEAAKKTISVAKTCSWMENLSLLKLQKLNRHKFLRNESHVHESDTADAAKRTSLHGRKPNRVPPESILGARVTSGGLCMNEIRRMQQQKQNKNKFRRIQM